MRKLKATKAVAVAALLATAQQAGATEGGGSTYPLGVENYMVAAAPPPGFYVMEYVTHYRADQLNDFNGNAIPIPGGFNVDAVVAATRFIWSSDIRVGNGTLVAHGILPLVDVQVGVAGARQGHGLRVGDIIFGPAVAYHYSPALHGVIGFDVVAPTGAYDRTRLANVGRNYWSVQPFVGMTHVNPSGFNGDFKTTLSFNSRNAETEYRSGTEFILDYSAGWGLGNGWVLGVGGHAYQQLRNDRVNGNNVPRSRGRSFAIGPSLKYDNGKGWFVTVKWQNETNVRNKPEGSALWIKTTLPF